LFTHDVRRDKLPLCSEASDKKLYVCKLHEYCVDRLSATQKFGSLSVKGKSVAAQLGQILYARV
jgi:hypothetical protein